MNPLVFEIIELALGVAKNAAAGTPAEGTLTNVQAFEQIVAKAALAYKQESGQPMDLSKLTQEDLIP